MNFNRQSVKLAVAAALLCAALAVTPVRAEMTSVNDNVVAKNETTELCVVYSITLQSFLFDAIFAPSWYAPWYAPFGTPVCPDLPSDAPSS